VLHGHGELNGWKTHWLREAHGSVEERSVKEKKDFRRALFAQRATDSSCFDGIALAQDKSKLKANGAHDALAGGGLYRHRSQSVHVKPMRARQEKLLSNQQCCWPSVA
jgi:hypothetical protein